VAVLIVVSCLTMALNVPAATTSLMSATTSISAVDEVTIRSRSFVSTSASILSPLSRGMQDGLGMTSQDRACNCGPQTCCIEVSTVPVVDCQSARQVVHIESRLARAQGGICHRARGCNHTVVVSTDSRACNTDLCWIGGS